MLHRVEKRTEKLKKSIPPQAAEEVARFGGKDPFAFTDVENAVRLDMLWTTFFVTGKFEPVRRLAGELRQRRIMTPKDAKQRLDEGRPLAEDEKKLLLAGVVQMAAVWSLEANLRDDHRLLGFYLETILARKLFVDRQEAALIASIIRRAASGGPRKGGAYHLLPPAEKKTTHKEREQ